MAIVGAPGGHVNRRSALANLAGGVAALALAGSASAAPPVDVEALADETARRMLDVLRKEVQSSNDVAAVVANMASEWGVIRDDVIARHPTVAVAVLDRALDQVTAYIRALDAIALIRERAA